MAQKIDYGNKFLGLDMIAREDTGEVINPKTSGVMKLFKSVRETACTFTYLIYLVCMSLSFALDENHFPA